MGVLASLGKLLSLRIQSIHALIVEDVQGFSMRHTHQKSLSSISGLVVEYIVAIDVTRVRFPADACSAGPCRSGGCAECRLVPASC